MDEARVVHSLATADQLSPTQITKVLGRGRAWVDRRLTLGQRLAPELARHLDAGRLSATTAHALASLPPGEQQRLIGLSAGAMASGREAGSAPESRTTSRLGPAPVALLSKAQ